MKISLIKQTSISNQDNLYKVIKESVELGRVNRTGRRMTCDQIESRSEEKHSRRKKEKRPEIIDSLLISEEKGGRGGGGLLNRTEGPSADLSAATPSINNRHGQ